MKKFFLIIASLALLCVSCAEKLGTVAEGDGAMVEVNFTANLESMATKAVADNDGMGAKATRCIMELYYGEELYYREEQPVNEKVAEFNNVTLVSSRTYEVLFWADAGSVYYNAEDLKAVKMTGAEYAANDDNRDAFFYRGQQKVAQKGESYSVELRRPFAQMNIITLDASAIKSESLYPETVEMVYTAPTEFNVYTGELGGEKELTVSGPVYATFDAAKPALTLEMDYLFAPEEKATLDIDFKASHSGEEDVVYAFTNIPYQRNYRTNIQGKLLTTTGNWTATIVPNWAGDGTDVTEDPYLVEYVEAGSIAAANEALKNSNAVSIENPEDAGTNDLVLPAEQDGKEVNLKISGTEGKTVTIVCEADGPANLIASADKGSLDITCPNTHVELTAGEYADITAKTGDNTLLIGNDVTAMKVKTTKGAVVINGIVNELSSNVIAEINISSAEGLMAYAAALNAGKYSAHYTNLVDDIDMTGKEWVPMSASNSSLRGFDGKEHVISNLTVTQSASGHSGLFGSFSGDIQNVTVKDAVVTYPESAGDQARVGVICSYFHGGNIINCHIDGAMIKAYQKVGGIVGNLEAYSNTVISNCSAKDITFDTNCNDLVYQAAGIVGYVQQASPVDIIVKDCSVENIVVKNAYSGSDNKSWHCHSLIGNISNTADGHTVALENNTVDAQLPVERTAYTSDYFGWAGNEEAGAGKYKAVITIDGQAWTPNYPFKNVTTGKGYATLDAAFAALQQDETLEIWQAGEYAVQTLSAPANSVIDAKVEGVVFNRTPGGAITSHGNASPVTVKNITWNIGSNNYQYFNCKAENCTINGRITGHTFVSLKDCNLINTYAEDYCVTTYASPCTFENCTFSSQGKFVNVYGESTTKQTEISAVNCKFVNLKSSVKKAAFNIKGNGDGQKQHAHVVIENCTTEGLFPDHTTTDGSAIFFDGGFIMFDDPAWEDDVYAVVDGITYYPYFTMDANGNYSVNNANGLKKAIKHWNALKVSGEKTIELADGTYEVSDLHLIQNLKDKSLLVKAKNEGKAVLTPDSGTKTHMIFIVSGGSNLNNPEHVTFEGLKFSMTSDPGEISSHPIYCPREPAKDPIGKLLGEEVSRYAHNINIIKCELQGFGTEYNSLINSPQSNSTKHVLVDGCTVNNAGYVVNGYFVDTKVLNTTVTNTKACVNANSQEVDIENCQISTYHDYCIRSNGGPIVVKNNTFNMTYGGDASDASIVYLRGSYAPTEATISGNTFTKASQTMYDCYCETAWTVNGEAKAAGTGINF